MPSKGMRSICFSPRTPSFAIAPATPSSHASSPARSSPARSMISNPNSTPGRRSFSDYRTEQIIDTAAAMITKWDPETSPYAKVTSLFYESKREAIQFLKCLTDLQTAMRLLSAEDSRDGRLVRAQNLMQIGMKRLQKEFYQILSTNRAYLDPESISTRSSRTSARSSVSEYDADDDDVSGADAIAEVEEASSIAMGDLRSIAECMISAGYAKECVSIYKVIRKSIIDEGIYRLGVERVSSLSKLSWESVELRVKAWLEAVKVAVRTLFHGERILCDHVFAAFDSVRESCFAEISKDGATLLFGFPELVAKIKKKDNSSPDRVFGILDMYTAISENWTEIESIFSFESTSAVRSQAINSLDRLAESVRPMLAEFESTIQKDKHSSNSKVPVPADGGLHPLTIYVTDYLSLLADEYSGVLADILQDWPSPPGKSSLPESFFDSPESDDSQAPALSSRFSWLILVLLCKLDGKAKNYKDVSLSYLFLANNLRHVVWRVRSSNLGFIVGEEWIAKHEGQVSQFAANYERLAWGPVLAALPENPTAAVSAEAAREVFKRFGSRFEEAYRKQSSCIVEDPKLRDEIKKSIARKLVARYRGFYEKNKATVGARRDVGIFVKYTPQDVGRYLSELFLEVIIDQEGSSSSTSSSTSSSSHRPHSRQRS